MVLPGSSATPSARCTVCKRRFELQPSPDEHADDIILRMREEFAAHNCDETAQDKVSNGASGLTLPPSLTTPRFDRQTTTSADSRLRTAPTGRQSRQSRGQERGLAHIHRPWSRQSPIRSILLWKPWTMRRKKRPALPRSWDLAKTR